MNALGRDLFINLDYIITSFYANKLSALLKEGQKGKRVKYYVADSKNIWNLRLNGKNQSNN